MLTPNLQLYYFQYFLLVLLLAVSFHVVSCEIWHAPPTGFATITQYNLPLDFITSCGCTAKSTHYPTAALSALAFGSAEGYGPGCGSCYRLKPLNTIASDPPWYPADSELQSIVIKVTDCCPASTEYCDATSTQPNEAGNYVNFDLAFPSTAIPSNFFPSNDSYYGNSDFGVWNASYEAISCTSWAGWNDSEALGSTPDRGEVCCPADTLNVTCSSYSEQPGAPLSSTFSPTASPSSSVISSSGSSAASTSILNSAQSHGPSSGYLLLIAIIAIF